MRARIGVIAVVLACGAVPCARVAALGRLPTQTPTTPASTTTSTAPSTTQAATSTVPTTVAPTTTGQATTTVPSTTTTSTTVPATTTTTAIRAGSGTSGATIGLIVGAVAAVLVIIAILLLILRRRAREQWLAQARAAASEASSLLDAAGRGLAVLDEPAAAARTWADLEARGAHLHTALQALVARPPDERAGTATAGVDRALQALRAAVNADRSSRLGPPPPTPEQLRYSEAVIRQRLADYEQSLGELEAYLREIQ